MNKLNFDDFSEFTKCNCKSTRPTLSHTLCNKLAKCNPFKYSFAVCNESEWNTLSRSVAEAENRPFQEWTQALS